MQDGMPAVPWTDRQERQAHPDECALASTGRQDKPCDYAQDTHRAHSSESKQAGSLSSGLSSQDILPGTRRLDGWSGARGSQKS